MLRHRYGSFLLLQRYGDVMSIAKITELGEVKISDQIVAQIISDSMSAEGIKNKIWPATVHGRQIGLLPKIVDAEFASNVVINTLDDGSITLEFSVIVKFGQSIKKITKELADLVSDNMKYMLGVTASIITINIAGVKSKQVAKRNTKAVYKYGTK